MNKIWNRVNTIKNTRRRTSQLVVHQFVCQDFSLPLYGATTNVFYLHCNLR